MLAFVFDNITPYLVSFYFLSIRYKQFLKNDLDTEKLQNAFTEEYNQKESTVPIIKEENVDVL